MKKITRISEEDIARNTQVYDTYHRTYRWEDGWDKGSKFENFERLMHLPELTGVPISGAAVLDVGCGTGDLSHFLRKRGLRRYVGIDIYESSLVKAEIKYPRETFIYGDILTGIVKSKFTYAFSSGAMSVKLSIDNYDFLQAMVRTMWRLTKVGVAFNLLLEDPDPDPELFFYNKDKVVEICSTIIGNNFIEVIEDEHKEQGHFYLYRR